MTTTDVDPTAVQKMAAVDWGIIQAFTRMGQAVQQAMSGFQREVHLNHLEEAMRQEADRAGMVLPLGPLEAVGKTCCPGVTYFRLKGWSRNPWGE